MKKQTLDILLKKFPPNEFALMAEVRDAAGFSASRSADFLIMGLWPSRGLDMIGIERKSFRGDWLSELKKPQKAENIYQYCDRWYLLTDNENVANINEIPLTWGWMHIDVSGKLKVIKEASKLTPITISKSFLACILKRAANKDGWVTNESIQDKVNEANQRGIQEGERGSKRIKESYDTLAKDVKKFEETTGLKLSNPRWGITGKQIGDATKFVMDGGIKDIESKMTFIKNYHSQIGEKIKQFEELKSQQI